METMEEELSVETADIEIAKQTEHFHDWHTVMTCKVCGIRNEILNYQKGWNNALDALHDRAGSEDTKKIIEELRK